MWAPNLAYSSISFWKSMFLLLLCLLLAVGHDKVFLHECMRTKLKVHLFRLFQIMTNLDLKSKFSILSNLVSFFTTTHAYLFLPVGCQGQKQSKRHQENIMVPNTLATSLLQWSLCFFTISLFSDLLGFITASFLIYLPCCEPFHNTFLSSPWLNPNHVLYDGSYTVGYM